MNSKQLRLVYMGTPEFAVAPLENLVESGYNIVGVITMPDKPAGRGLKMQQSAVKQYALEAGLPIMQPEKLKAPDFVEAFKALNPDLGIVIAFRMLPEVIWEMPSLGTFNLHASLLPQYRGAAPINWAIINGETQTGVTTFMLNHEIDKGDILGQAVVDIAPSDNAGSLHDKLMVIGTDLVAETIDRIATSNAKPLPQTKIETENLRPAPKIFKEDCRIDWRKNGSAIHNLVRGLSPYPSAFSNIFPKEKHELTQQVKIYRTEFEDTPHNHELGTILSDEKKIVKVVCVDGYIHILELQLSGKKRMTAEEFLRGFKNISDYRFS